MTSEEDILAAILGAIESSKLPAGWSISMPHSTYLFLTLPDGRAFTCGVSPA